MGRKIPAKKHRGVKDPLEQQAKRLKSLKGKINAPPRDPDEQPVPRSLQLLFAPRARSRPDAPPRRPPAHAQNGKPQGRTAVSRLARLRGEPAREFAARISSAVRALHDPASLRYPADVEEEDRKGARMAALRERRERKRRVASRGAGAAGGGGAGGDVEGEGGIKLSRMQRRALKLKEKKLKAAEAAAIKPELVYERVRFGAAPPPPPALPAPRRAAAAASAARPGRRDLLLSALLRGGATGAGGAGGAGAATPPAPPAAGERARLAAVAAYRALKAARAGGKDVGRR